MIYNNGINTTLSQTFTLYSAKLSTAAIYAVSQKLDPFSFQHNFRKYGLILTTLSLLQS